MCWPGRIEPEPRRTNQRPDEVCAAQVLSEPGFGIIPAVEALPQARRSFDARIAVLAREIDSEGEPELD